MDYTYQIGDEVKIVSYECEPTSDLIGKIGTITRLYISYISVSFDKTKLEGHNGMLFLCNEIIPAPKEEPIPKITYKHSALKQRIIDLESCN